MNYGIMAGAICGGLAQADACIVKNPGPASGLYFRVVFPGISKEL